MRQNEETTLSLFFGVRRSSVTRNFKTIWRDIVIDILLAGLVTALMFIRERAKRFSGTG